MPTSTPWLDRDTMLDTFLISQSVMWGMALVGALMVDRRPVSAVIATLNLIAVLIVLFIPEVR